MQKSTSEPSEKGWSVNQLSANDKINKSLWFFDSFPRKSEILTKNWFVDTIDKTAALRKTWTDCNCYGQYTVKNYLTVNLKRLQILQNDWIISTRDKNLVWEIWLPNRYCKKKVYSRSWVINGDTFNQITRIVFHKTIVHKMIILTKWNSVGWPKSCRQNFKKVLVR